MKNRIFGGKMDQTFYKKLASLMFPIVFQNLMLASVAVADAIMLGSVEQNSMAAVSLATQIQFIQNMFLGAIVASVAILGAQYWGKGDKDTLNDILDAFVAPNRDPRDDIEAPLLRSDVLKLEDLKPGMELQGTVRNVVDFGVFVDCGVKEDGLVHLSKMRKQFVKHPMDVVSVGDIVKVWVDSVDLQRKRLALTMIAPEAQ